MSCGIYDPQSDPDWMFAPDTAEQDRLSELRQRWRAVLAAVREHRPLINQPAEAGVIAEDKATRTKPKKSK